MWLRHLEIHHDLSAVVVAVVVVVVVVVIVIIIIQWVFINVQA
jgi:hypothetical protein